MEHTLTAFVRRLSKEGDDLYLRFSADDVSRNGLAHGEQITLTLRPGTTVTGVLKTSGGNQWLAPVKGSSNRAITAVLRNGGFEHGNDVAAMLSNVAPAIRTAAFPSRSAPHRAPTTRTADEPRMLADALTRDFPVASPSTDPAWTRAIAVRVVDCVLSLNRKYDGFVVPRISRFERDHPATTSLSDLRQLMDGHPSPAAFMREALDYNDAARAETLSGVVDYLLELMRSQPHVDEQVCLQAWARMVAPGEYKNVGVSGFGIAGFQYLRMLFGADTTKPDTHIISYVSDAVGRPVSDIEALQLLEAAAPLCSIRVRDADTLIWERRARG
jgi:hypothetical protein